MRIRARIDRDRTTRRVIPVAAALATLLLHLVAAGRYGYFRDELYFIACGRHLAWGYVDQPPLVALAAWMATPANHALVALRALPMLCAALTVYVAVVLTRELGGGRFAQLLTAVATGLLPANLLLGSTLTTSSFEPLSWTLVVYAAVRIVRGGGARWWAFAALAVAFGGYAKYSIALPALAVVAGLACTPQRRALQPFALGGAALLAVALLAPNLAWQAIHGWPFFEVLRGDATHRPALQNGLALESAGMLRNAAAFALEQLAYTNPLAAPIWIAGIVAPFRRGGPRDLRFIPIAYAAIVGIAIATGAKGYYIAGIYPSLIALGAPVIEQLAIPLRTALATGLVVVAIAASPLAAPILPIGSLIDYSAALHLTGAGGTPPRLIQPVFAEEFGWRRLTRDVASVYAALPPRERNRAAIYADTYADAAALDFFGPAEGLPPAISSQNSYYLWGARGYDGSVLVAIGATRIDRLHRFYRSVTLVRTSTEPLRWVVEGPSPIYLCRDPIVPLATMWPSLRWFGA